MPTTPPANETAPRVDEQFLDLIYGDTDLLAAEFDAIIAAEWPEPPTDSPGRSAAGGDPDSVNQSARGGCSPRPHVPPPSV